MPDWPRLVAKRIQADTQCRVAYIVIEQQQSYLCCMSGVNRDVPGLLSNHPADAQRPRRPFGRLPLWHDADRGKLLRSRRPLARETGKRLRRAHRGCRWIGRERSSILCALGDQRVCNQNSASLHRCTIPVSISQAKTSGGTETTLAADWKGASWTSRSSTWLVPSARRNRIDLRWDPGSRRCGSDDGKRARTADRSLKTECPPVTGPARAMPFLAVVGKNHRC
jgi:hypothetical protein